MNPLSDKMTHLRSSLIPGLLNTADFNHNNGRKDLMLFEIGNVFNKTGKGLKGINENFQLSGIILGDLLHPSVHQRNAIKIIDWLAKQKLQERFRSEDCF